MLSATNATTTTTSGTTAGTAPFVHTSPVSSQFHDPLVSLSSHCIRIVFGPTVQLIADALQSRGPLTLVQLLTYLRRKLPPQPPNTLAGVYISNSLSSTSTSRQNQQLTYDPASVRASLLVLIQHGIVVYDSASKRNVKTLPTQSPTATPAYSYKPSRARNLLRYAKYIEFIKKSHGNKDDVDIITAVLQTLLLRGRLCTMDWMMFAVQELTSSAAASSAVGGATSTTVASTDADGDTEQQQNQNQHHRYTKRQQVVEAVYKLITQGFVKRVNPMNLDDDDDDDEHEATFDENNEIIAHKKQEDASSKVKSKSDETNHDSEPPKKKVRLTKEGQHDNTNDTDNDHDTNNDNNGTCISSEDPVIVALIQGNAHYKATLPIDHPGGGGGGGGNTLWQVNTALFHEYFQAYQLGRLVAERYGWKVQSCGSLVTAALRFKAQQKHCTSNHGAAANGNNSAAVAAAEVHNDTYNSFVPSDIIKYLPKPVIQLFEKKVGGLQLNLCKAFEDLSLVANNPTIVRPVGDGDSYEVTVRPILQYIQQRICHQIVQDRHGEIAARIIRILTLQGFLEADTIAEHAMIPVKDTREVLHTLYRSRYIEMLHISTSARQQYNPSNAIYLWGVHKDRLRRKVTENVAQALLNIRLRRQHQVEVGRDWIERAHQAADTDENDHETDRLNYQRFCLGLERLDVAAMQLDETLMVMNDFELDVFVPW